MVSSAVLPIPNGTGRGLQDRALRAAPTSKALTVARSSSIAEQQDAFKRQTQPTTGKNRIELGLRLSEALHLLKLAARLMPVLDHDTQYQVPGADDERGTYKIPVDGIAPSSTTGLNLKNDAELVMDTIDLIRHPNSALVAKQHRTPDLLSSLLSRLNLEAQTLKARTKMLQHDIGRESVDHPRIDLRPCSLNHTNEGLDPVRRRLVRRKAKPSRILAHDRMDSSPWSTYDQQTPLASGSWTVGRTTYRLPNDDRYPPEDPKPE